MIPVFAHWLYSDEDWENIWLSDPIALDDLQLISSQAQEAYEHDLEETDFDEI